MYEFNDNDVIIFHHYINKMIRKTCVGIIVNEYDHDRTLWYKVLVDGHKILNVRAYDIICNLIEEPAVSLIRVSILSDEPVKYLQAVDVGG